MTADRKEATLSLTILPIGGRATVRAGVVMDAHGGLSRPLRFDHLLRVIVPRDGTGRCGLNEISRSSRPSDHAASPRKAPVQLRRSDPQLSCDLRRAQAGIVHECA